MVVSWIQDDPRLVLVTLLNTTPSSSQPMGSLDLTPLAGLVRWCVKAPLAYRRDRKQGLTNGTSDTKPEAGPLFSALHLSVLQVLLLLPGVLREKGLLGRLALLQPEQLSLLISDLSRLLELNPLHGDSKTQSQLALDRLGQALQVAMAARALLCSREDLRALCSRLPHNNLLQLVLSGPVQQSGFYPHASTPPLGYSPRPSPLGPHPSSHPPYPPQTFITSMTFPLRPTHWGSPSKTEMNQFDHLKDSDPEDQEESVCNQEEDGSVNNNPRKMVSAAAGEHPLQYNYTFWYSRRTPSRPANTISYEQNIRQIGTVASVEQFWKFYSHLVRPGDLTGHSDFHLFKEGIKPMWEDEANKNGGKWIIRLRKGLASRFWENIILAMLGEQFMVGEEICGVVVSIRFQEDILSIWNKTSSDQVTTSRIRDTLRRVLNLPPNTIMEYKTHNDSLKDNSSFRNTKITL
ncbi:hypothetical protein UPYG_G00056250 [Umbra pygmaea]|uniref:Eukaryotic translation initiation factor 4E type 2 n=1 Tax=Umbra pygmaea TaxID=75934 RepID=A0ABD0X8Y7_UMBPY